MDTLVYVVIAVPMFLSIGMACYTVLIQRYQLIAIGLMIFNIFACMSFMENYYDSHTPTQKQSKNITITCEQKSSGKLVCKR